MTKDIRGKKPSMAFYLSVIQALLLGRSRWPEIKYLGMSTTYYHHLVVCGKGGLREEL